MPLEADEVAAITDEVAASDKSVSSNGRSLTSHSLQELMAYEDYREEKAARSGASSQPHFGLRFSVMRPGGCG